MKYDQEKNRPIVMGENGMVAAGHPLATLAGVRALQDGANAIDAAVVASAVLSVVDPAASGLGGDLFFLHYSARSGRMESLNGSGRAPMAIDPGAFAEGIPSTGPLSITVPGIVMGWEDALQRHGTWSLQQALGPAIAYAEKGFPVSERVALIFKRKQHLLERCKAVRDTYFVNGIPVAGQRLRLPDLAASLQLIAENGAAVFYRGALAEQLVKAVRADGGCFSMDDFADHQSQWDKPLLASYRDFEVAVQQPVSMGAILLQQLKIVEGYELASMVWDSGARIHLFIEAKKASFADLEDYLSDPAFTPPLPKDFLTPDYAAQRRSLISLDHAASLYPPGGSEGRLSHTTYLAVVDGKGNAVSWIQTVFDSFGSCWMAPDTGFMLNNRLYGFSPDRTHVNRLEPGKRTAHTLLAPIVLKEGKPVLILGTPGDYGQTQSNLQLITNFVDYGMDVQSMIEAPRWRSLSGLDIAIEDRFSESSRLHLQKCGHVLQLVGPWSDLMGGAQAIRVNVARGFLEGGADPRREGYAIGW